MPPPPTGRNYLNHTTLKRASRSSFLLSYPRHKSSLAWKSLPITSEPAAVLGLCPTSSLRKSHREKTCMSDPLNPVRRLVARIRALLPEDWRGKAGEHFRETLESVSEFAEEHNVRPRDLAGEGVELGRRKLQGLANKELASATKDFADAEQTKIETELKRRSLESRVRKEEAETRIAEAKALDAEVELFAKMEKIGVVFRYD